MIPWTPEAHQSSPHSSGTRHNSTSTHQQPRLLTGFFLTRPRQRTAGRATKRHSIFPVPTRRENARTRPVLSTEPAPLQCRPAQVAPGHVKRPHTHQPALISPRPRPSLSTTRQNASADPLRDSGTNSQAAPSHPPEPPGCAARLHCATHLFTVPTPAFQRPDYSADPETTHPTYASQDRAPFTANRPHAPGFTSAAPPTLS